MGFVPFTFIDLIDILFVAYIMYWIYRTTKGTNAPYIISGIIVVYLLWVIVKTLNMELLSTILGHIISVGAIALIVVFQPEIRRFLQKIGMSQKRFNFISRIFNHGSKIAETNLQPLVVACREMSDTKTGALVVIGQQSDLSLITEGGICLALALVLRDLTIPIGLSFGGFGGSITLVMVPLILFAVRYGAPWGILAGIAFGTLKYFFAEGFAVSWVSIIFDYSVAYGAVGLAGLFRVKDNDYSKLPLAAFVGCLGRFVIHFISGVTVYAQYMPEEFMGMTMTSPVFYSVLYNGTYMLPNTILAIVICALLMKPAAKLPSAE